MEITLPENNTIHFTTMSLANEFHTHFQFSPLALCTAHSNTIHLTVIVVVVKTQELQRSTKASATELYFRVVSFSSFSATRVSFFY